MPTNPLIAYGRKLRQLRENAGLTQNNAALRIGVSTTSLRNWETGRKLPSAINLRRLQLAYDVMGEEIDAIDGLLELSKQQLIKTLSEVINAD